jgi:serine/threonine-protein kinase
VSGAPVVGSVLGGKYRVLDTLGTGGMGIVFCAENLVTTKRVALKWLPRRVSEGAYEERLLREARAVARLKHPNVVDVYDLLRHGATWFLVMELLEGETLRDYLRRSPPPSVPELIAQLLPAMEGVSAAHARGVIHRDLKPENIFLERVAGDCKVVPKVLDFGIAKLSDTGGHSLTATGVALGTPLYMSLEQLRADKDVDERADVYAFGVMLYEAFSGRTPYEASSLPELALKLTTTQPAPLQQLRPDLPASLARIVDWAIALDRAERLPDLTSLRDELEVFSREHSFRALMPDSEDALPRVAAAPQPAAPAKVATRGTTLDAMSAPAVVATGRRALLRPRAGWLALGGAVALLGLLARAYWPSTSSAAPSVSSAAPAETANLSEALRTAQDLTGVDSQLAQIDASREQAALVAPSAVAQVESSDGASTLLDSRPLPPPPRQQPGAAARSATAVTSVTATHAHGKPMNRSPARPRQDIVDMLGF